MSGEHADGNWGEFGGPAHDATLENEAEAAAEAILSRWQTGFEARALFAADRALAGELRHEARPTVHALLLGEALDTVEEPTSLEHHEAIAMTSLLGRRVAVLGVTPSSARRVLPALLAAFAETENPVPGSLGETLGDAFFEGYVRGGLERREDERLAAAAEAQPTLDLGDGLLALVLVGEHDPERLMERVEEFGRELFRREARACIVDLSGMGRPSRALAHVVFGVDASARMLGLRVRFTGVDELWRELLVDVAGDPELIAVEPSFGAALAASREKGGVRERIRRALQGTK